MARFDSDAFLEQVKLLGGLPSGRYTNPQILAVASNQINSVLLPLILDQKEEYYLTSEDQAVTQNQAAYPIPYRAMGLSLREVKLVKSSGEVVDLPRIDPTEVKTTATGTPWAFYLQGQDVILYPTPATTDGSSVQLSYFLTPSRLVELSECGRITNINRSTGVIDAVIPSTWTTSDTFDLVSSKNGHQTKAFDLTASNITISTDITFNTADIPSSIVVGDYVCLSGESPYIQAPDVCFQYVAQLTANVFHVQMENETALQTGTAMAQQLGSMVVTQLKNRVQGASKRLRISL